MIAGKIYICTEVSTTYCCKKFGIYILFSCIVGQESTTDCSNSRRYWKSIGREIEPIASSFFPTRIAANAAIFATSRKQWQRCCCSSYWGWWGWNWGPRFQPCTIASSNAATANLLIASSSKWLFKVIYPKYLRTQMNLVLCLFLSRLEHRGSTEKKSILASKHTF